MRAAQPGPAGRERHYGRISDHASPVQPRNRQNVRRHRPHPCTSDRGEGHGSGDVQISGARGQGPGPGNTHNMILYALTIVVSAFLLFQVQPVIAKVILPWFGGSAAVWSTCMLFFQVVLLLGYVYAHWLYHRVRGRGQPWLHSVLLGASLLALPILPNPRWRTATAGDPSWRILALLALTIGLPYFLLSSTSPLLQAWYASTHKRAVP